VMFFFGAKKLVKKIKKVAKGAAPDNIKMLMNQKTIWKHPWTEYEESLHKKWKINGEERRLESVRATLPAETFFNSNVLVDS
ncbi:hypothetical protein ABTM31_21085, partial [Acinetobacter baumannii]